jgi:N-acetylglutamate synthase/N-acetylornithine aminotransferase
MQQHQAMQALYCRHVASTKAFAVPRAPVKCVHLDGDLSTPDMLLTLATSPQYEEMYPHVFYNNQTFASASGRSCYC